ncbi:MAG: chorismate synthase [Firmicutes bacterium]|nr:chorismate synthase [Bacillota bacterium]
MKNTFGSCVTVTIFGESHGSAVGAVLDGIEPGLEIDEEFISHRMNQRRAVGALSTARREDDRAEILSGVYRGTTTGTPISFLIYNKNTKSADYDALASVCRPGHADYTGYIKYKGFGDYRGGGHFSGRITAGLVAAGAVAELSLMRQGIRIGTHIKRCGGVSDREFSDVDADISALSDMDFAVLDGNAEKAMKERILAAKSEGDSVGGVLETAICGLPAGVGEPWFDTVEGVLSHMMFSIPAIKGVEFGGGFSLADMKGSESNDSFYASAGEIHTKTNRCGGILGGISDGEPIIMRCAVKPTPSIYKEQESVNLKTRENVSLRIEGRHDPAVVHRARAVVNAGAALAVRDLLSMGGFL